MNRQVVVDIVERLPQAVISRAWGWVARRRRPRAGVEVLKRAFVSLTGIDLTEANDGIEDFENLEELFVRKLRPGARRIEPDSTAVVSPVDGLVGACGLVQNDTLFQVKGRSYSLRRLLDDPENARRFEGGAYATFYLSPKDYHRIHSPVSGIIREARIVPGGLMPVFPEALTRVDELFARNERLITYVDTTHSGRVAVVKVGATLVGRISLAFDSNVYTNQKGQTRRTLTYNPPHLIQKGAEIGAFELGSTVVLVAEKDRLDFGEICEGSSTRMGLRIGTIAPTISKLESNNLGSSDATKLGEDDISIQPDSLKASKSKSKVKKKTSRKAPKKKL